MTTRVMLVRHGSTVLAAEDRFAGSSDVPLSEEGEAQARALGERLRGRKIDACYCSPMGRTVRTAQLIVEPHGLVPQPVPAFKEIDHGHWEKLTRAEVEAQFGDEYQTWEKNPFSFAPQGGESGLSVLARALPALQDLVRRHEGQTILVVSHKATIRLLLGSFLGFDLRGYRDHLDQSPCSLNILDFKNPAQARLMLFNDVSHYETWHGMKQASLSKWWDESEPEPAHL
jgi:broad specificity phosphatase PhoE